MQVVWPKELFKATCVCYEGCMPKTQATNAVEIFLAMVRAVRSGVPMTPHSANDKEYFAQDWFRDRLQERRLTFEQQGRNSYPDFLVQAPPPPEGFEVKSLSFSRGMPARKDIDFNSTIPSGRKNDQDIFLVFFLYTGTGKDPRTVHTISLAHADLINADHEVADEHVNVAIHEFGSYGDGFIRNRKMYVFPHPITIDPSGLGRQRLIVPTGWNLADGRLKKLGILQRTITGQAIDRYTIKLHGRGEADVETTPYERAGQDLVFDVFEAL